MSEELPVPATANSFERIKRVNQSGAEFWSARELARVLEYREFRNLSAAIAKAREACTKSGHAVSDHFVLFNEMVGIGSGAQLVCGLYGLTKDEIKIVEESAK
jgi:DNA-damage-inducible protein D